MTERGRLNPLWARSPLVLRRYPGLLAAVCVGALLLAVAAASSPLFLSATGGSALRRELAAVTPFGAGLEIKKADLFGGQQVGFQAGVDAPTLAARDRAVESMVAGVGHLSPAVRTLLGQPMQIFKPRAPGVQRGVRLLARTGALDHVRKLRGTGSPGAWITDAWAKELGVRPGNTIVISNTTSFTSEEKRTRVRVAGVYRGLYQLPSTPYWRNLYKEIYPAKPRDPPPSPFLIISREDAVRLNTVLGPERVELHWEYPLKTRGLALDEAKGIGSSLEAAQARLLSSSSPAARKLGCGRGFRFEGYAFGFGCETITSLDTAIRSAEADVAALRGPADLLTTAGTLVALAVVAAAGAFLVARRRTEAALLHARGMSPLVFGGKTLVETLLPAVGGTVIGFAAAFFVVETVGPDGPTGASAILDALRTAGLRLLLSLAVLDLAAAVAFIVLSERRRSRPPILRWVPWELALVAVAGFCLARITSGDGLIEEAGGVERPSAFVILFPIFFIAGFAGIVARLWGPVLRALRRRSKRLGAASYLAVHRLAGAERLAVLLVAACALSLGTFVYAQTLVHSLERSVVVKSKVFAGSDVQGIVNNDQAPPKSFPFPVTKVTKAVRGGEVANGGAQVDLMAVDPRTLARAAYWEPSWSQASLDEIARQLAAPAAQSVPVVLVGGSLPDESRFTIDGTPIAIEVVARATAFPGMFKDRLLLVAAFEGWERAFEVAGIADQFRVAGAEGQLWIKGDEARAAAVLRTSSVRPFDVLTAGQIRENPSNRAATRTFSFLKSLGFAGGLLAVVGMLLYLQARQRSRVVSYSLSRRMGLTGRGHLLALALELGATLLSALVIGAALALIAASVVLGDVDPLANIPPDPLFWVPVPLLVGTAIGLAVVAAFGAALAGRSAERANVSEVMRLAD